MALLKNLDGSDPRLERRPDPNMAAVMGQIPLRPVNAQLTPLAQPRDPHETIDNLANAEMMAEHPNDPNYLENLADINAGRELAKVQYEQAHPWGTPENHPGVLGKVGHALGTAGQIAGGIVIPRSMPEIPGTQANLAAREDQLSKQVDTGREERTAAQEAGTREMAAETEAKKVDEDQAGDWKPVTGTNWEVNSRSGETRQMGGVPEPSTGRKAEFFMGPDGKAVQGYSSGGENFLADGTPLPQGYTPYKAPATGGRPIAGAIGGKPAWGVYQEGKGWTDVNGNPMPGFTPPPSWAESLLPTHTIQLTDPNTALPAIYHWQYGAGGNIVLSPVETPSGEPGALPGAGTYAHQVQSATALERMVNQNVLPLVDQMQKKGELGIVKGRVSDWLNRDVGKAPPDVSQLHQLMNGVVSMMMGMYGFRRQQAVAMLSAQMGARMTPENLRASLKGIMQHAQSISGGATKTPPGPEFSIPKGAPSAKGVADGKYLYDNGKPIAKAQNGQWVAP